MNIFNAIQLTPTGAGPVCKYCTHFNNDPADIEKAYPGLTALSSAFASVRHQDGFCDHHQFYLSSLDSCMQFMAEGEPGGKIVEVEGLRRGGLRR